MQAKYAKFISIFNGFSVSANDEKLSTFIHFGNIINHAKLSFLG